jgi:serine/threonine protein kinase
MIKQLERQRYKRGGSTKYYIDCNKYSENTDEIQIEGILQEKNDISVLRAVVTARNARKDDTIHRKYRYIVVKIDRADKTNRKEYTIGERLFQMHIPGFIRYICIFPCYDTTPHDVSGRICQAEPIEKNRKDVLVMPHLSEGSIDTYPWDESTLPILKCLLMQTVMSTLIAYTTVGFIHNDLHLGNILIKKTKKNEIDYVLGTDHIPPVNLRNMSRDSPGQSPGGSSFQYSIPTMGYKIVIVDFGNSMLYVQEKDQLFYWFDLLNVFSRVNLDLKLSRDRKIVWNDDSVIDFVKRARDSNAHPRQAIQLLRIIHQTTFRFNTIPITVAYDPNVYG